MAITEGRKNVVGSLSHLCYKYIYSCVLTTLCTILYTLYSPHGNHTRNLQLEARGRSSGVGRSYLGIVNFVNSVSKEIISLLKLFLNLRMWKKDVSIFTSQNTILLLQH